MPASSAVRSWISASVSASRASFATCSTSAREMGSATTGESRKRLLRRFRRFPATDGDGVASAVRVVAAAGVVPPVGGRGGPRRVLDDAVDGADGGQALPAPGAELREDD